MSDESKSIGAISLSIVGNTGLAIIKWLAGYFGNSYALIADAIESTSDIFSSVLVLFGLKYAAMPPDENHPYGHGKAESIITFIVGCTLVASGTIIAYESIPKIITPHAPPKPYTLIVVGTVMVIKEIFYRIVARKAKQTRSTSLRADSWHHRSDAITSLCVFIGISIAIFGGKGYESADGWAALIAAGIIFYNSYLIFRPALGEIMDEQLYDDVIAEIRQVASTVDGVLYTEKCLVRKSGMKYLVDLHVTVDATITVKLGHEISHHLKDKLLKEMPKLADVLIHIEPNDHS